MKPVLKGRCDSEVAATTAQTPKEIRVVLSTGPQEPTVSRDEVHRREIVAGEPIGAREPPEAASQREARDACGALQPPRARERERL